MALSNFNRQEKMFANLFSTRVVSTYIVHNTRWMELRNSGMKNSNHTVIVTFSNEKIILQNWNPFKLGAKNFIIKSESFNDKNHLRVSTYMYKKIHYTLHSFIYTYIRLQLN